MEQACFTGVVAEDQIGHFETGYHCLTFSKQTQTVFPFIQMTNFMKRL